MRAPSFSVFLACFAFVAGCSSSTQGTDDSGAVVDSATESDGAVADAATSEEGGLDAGAMADASDAAPEPECTIASECDDSSDCTTDTCEEGVCVHDNPLATCARFEGVECAGTLATSLLTMDRTFCIPSFVMNDPMNGDISLCVGQKCAPNDAEDGCLITFESTGLPSTEPMANVLHVAGRVTSITGTVPFTGAIPAQGGGTTPISCNAVFSVGAGLPIDADLTLTEEMACGTERTVTPASDVDLANLTVTLTGSGGNAILCAIANSVIGGQVNDMLEDVEPELEAGINEALTGLDCGTCNTDCPADLVCIAQ